jgi:signal transduction histidine kinase
VKEAFNGALGRSLSLYSGQQESSPEAFFRQAAWEIFHLVDGDFSALAFVIKSGEGSYFVGKPGDVHTLPAEVLQGFILPKGAAVPCQIRDHALDTVRFIDSHVRTSIAVQVAVPDVFGREAEGILWCGSPGSASRERIELARAIADATSAWLAIYAPVISALARSRQAAALCQERIREMTAIAHDARAPLGALKYLMADVGSEHTDLSLDWRRISEEVSYVERLMARFSPVAESPRVSEGFTSDLAEILARVAERFQPEIQAKGGTLSKRFPYVSLAVRIAPLDLERICSNIIGNAVRHAAQGPIEIAVVERNEREVALRISDSGPGFPQSVIDRISREVGSGAPIEGAVGWGVGLLACKEVVRRHGGKLSVSSGADGATVEVVLQRAEEARKCSRGGDALREPEWAEKYVPMDVHLLIVDDDVEHSASLARILRRDGIISKSVESVEVALKALAVDQTSQVTILCDANMPDGGAERLLRDLGTHRQRARIGVISGEDDERALYRFAALGAREFFAKPVPIRRLVSWVRS